MSGYPTGSGGYPYGGPPSSQPYGAPPAAPYGAPPGAPYGGYGSPSPAPYGGASQYGGAAPYPPSGSEKPSKAQQGNAYNPSAPPPSDPYSTYGAHYGQPGGEKPSKTQQGYNPSAPPPSDPYGSYGAPYGGEKPSKMQQGGGYQPSAPPPPQGQYGANPYGPSPFAALVPSAFPPGTDPNVVASFQVADQDGSGFIDDKELQGALSSYNQKFSLRTVHLMMYLFTSSNVRKIGPKEFISVFYSLQSWRAIFERFDRDRSGQIDSSELRDALLSLGFSVSPVVLDLLVSKFDKTGGKNKAIEYDNFIECCLTVKGLTEKFKEKDVGFTGSATFNYESFMLTVLPFLIA